MTWRVLIWSYIDCMGYEIGVYDDGSEWIIGKAGDK
jgi:hypothetical protein